MRMTILAGLAFVLLAGCGSDDGATAAAPGRPRSPARHLRARRRDRRPARPPRRAARTAARPSPCRTSRRPLKLTGKELETLASDLQSTDLGSLPKNSTSQPPVADAFGYRVSYGGDTVVTDDPAACRRRCAGSSRGSARSSTATAGSRSTEDLNRWSTGRREGTPMSSIRRLVAVVALVALLLLLPVTARAHAGLVPPPWSGHRPATAEARAAAPRPPAAPVHGVLAGGGALILVALLGGAGRTLTTRLA